MAEKMKKVTPETPSKISENSSRKWYPSFHLKLSDIPEAKQWELGKTYMLVIGVKMKSMHMDSEGSAVVFDVLKVKSINKQKQE